MKRSILTATITATLAALALAACSKTEAPATDGEVATSATPSETAPVAEAATDSGPGYPTHVYFGDTHLHTALSMDAGAAGANLMPADAYRFAKGEAVTGANLQQAQLSRPLDFLVVADHSDQMGLITDLKAGKPELLANPVAKRWYDLMQEGKQQEAAIDLVTTFAQGKFPKDIMYNPGSPGFISTWHSIVQAAEDANEPGKFTALIGYEWTSLVNGANMHRNVIFRGNGEKARQASPFTNYPPGSSNPRDLWKWMDAYEAKTGDQVLAIAHNGNLSNGIMFPVDQSYDGQPVDSEYAKTRANRERVYEATQMKGDSETHPFLSPTDEFADFENWDKGNLDLTAAKKTEMLEFEYVRSALKNGLELEAKLGTNPYKFGLIGSTDSHTGLATADDDNFWGKLATSEPSPERTSHAFIDTPLAKIMSWEEVASGYAAIWATENTREALYDALQRKEVYATTGPRMTVRFFGGWDYNADDAKGDIAKAGYTKGVPMGGDLSQAQSGKSPTFLIAVSKDPEGANLDRAQIVKGWVDANGESQEKVYEAVWAGDRELNAEGKLAPLGSTVDVAKATYTNTIGSAEFVKTWQDPEFDPTQRAFYYLRVVEIPTPRWTAYDAARYNLDLPKEVPMQTQERAYSSPIWYTPEA